jgi:hypothetical protein
MISYDWIAIYRYKLEYYPIRVLPLDLSGGLGCPLHPPAYNIFLWSSPLSITSLIIHTIFIADTCSKVMAVPLMEATALMLL